MKLAVTYEEGQVFQHFGHTGAFKIYDIQDGAVADAQVVPTCGSGHGALAGFLQEQGVQALICGGIGMGARFALQDADIEVFGGVSGDADEAVKAYLAGALAFNPNATCNHHHDHDHDCGDHHECGGHCGHHHE